MIAVVDYGVGNLFSLLSSLKFIGADACVTSDSDIIESADGVILPGVGAFADAYDKLNSAGLIPTVKKIAAEGKPLLGICLGMQLFFDKSFEFGEHKGLSLIPGEVVELKPGDGLKVPHMGWNALRIKRGNPLFKYINDGDHVYYVHSFCALTPPENLLAVSDYGIEVTGAVNKKNVYGTQFHPEKSGDTGLKILRAFGEIARDYAKSAENKEPLSGKGGAAC